MDYRSLHMKTVADLRRIAREEGVHVPTGTNKEILIQLILEHAEAGTASMPVQASAPVTSAAPARRGRPRKKDVEGATSAATVQAEPEASHSASAELQQAISQPVQTDPVEMASQPMQADADTYVQSRLPLTEVPMDTEGNMPAPVDVTDTGAQQMAGIENRGYRRSLSTQQRMGARSQPVQNAYRAPAKSGMQQGRVNRYGADANAGRPTRAYDQPQGAYRRPAVVDDGGAYVRRGTAQDDIQGAYRRVPAYDSTGAYVRRAPMADDMPQYRVPAVVEDAQLPPQNMEGYARRGCDFGGDMQPRPGVADEYRTANPGVPELLATGECGDGDGILEIHPDGYGFLRAENYLPGNRDVYVSAAQIRRFNLRTGDYVVGKTRAQQAGDRSVGLIFINEVNGMTPDAARNRKPFDSLIPVYPNQRLRLENPEKKDISLRIIDMLAPIGMGQRGMIVSQPKAGKTTLLKKVANAITHNNPDVHLIVLLIDERPEEVTDMKRSIDGEVVYSTFDEAPENHARVSEMVLERAQRLVEIGKDVVVLLDSITRLARAYNLVIPPTGRSLSGGLDPGALYKPKRFFGAARNIEDGGSLTIIATALVDTGSRMDDIIFEEFKGTGNMELHLDRSLSDRRIFPAIDMYKSGTRREELLLTKEELEGSYQVRRMLSKGSPQETAEQLISLMDKTKDNIEFFKKLKGWMSVYEKEGFNMH